MHRRTGVVVVQRHRAVAGGDDGGRPAGTPGEVVAEPGDVAQGRRHEQELRPGQLEQRHLPGPAAVRVGVVVELVHHDEPEVGVRALAQRLVGDDLGGRGDDRRARVHRRVAGEHADVLRAEGRAQREELLRHERLDRRGPHAAPALRERGVQRAGRHQALARSRWASRARRCCPRPARSAPRSAPGRGPGPPRRPTRRRSRTASPGRGRREPGRRASCPGHPAPHREGILGPVGWHRG